MVLAMAAMLAVASSCAEPGRPPQAGSAPTASPTAPVAGAATTGDEAGALAKAVEKLGQATSYRFTIQAVHHWRSPEGQEYDWSFDGEGAAVGPDRFYSVMQGPADSLFKVKMVGGKITNEDTRGFRPEASTAFGGPGVGSAPYTIISYLKSGTAQGTGQTASLNGSETRRLSFVPNLSKVAAMDASHKGLQEKVQAAQGSVWVDIRTGRVSQEAVTVQARDGRGLPQTTTVTLKFYDYDAAIEIN